MPGTFLCWLWSWLKPPLAWDGCFLVQKTLEMQRKHHLFKCLLRWYILRPSWWSRNIQRSVSPIGGIFEVVIFQKASRNNQQYKYMYIRIYIYKTIDRGVCSYEVIGRSRVQVYYVAFQRADFGSHLNCCHSVCDLLLVVLGRSGHTLYRQREVIKII